MLELRNRDSDIFAITKQTLVARQRGTQLPVADGFTNLSLSLALECHFSSVKFTILSLRYR